MSPSSCAWAVDSGLSPDDVISRLGVLDPTPGRMERVALGNGAVLLCDYFKSGLETIHSALDLLAAVPARRKTVVLGDVSEPPGSQGPIYKAIGRRLAEVAHQAVLVSSRNQSYRSGASEAGMPRSCIHEVNGGILAAAELLREELAEGDVERWTFACSSVGRSAIGPSLTPAP